MCTEYNVAICSQGCLGPISISEALAKAMGYMRRLWPCILPLCEQQRDGSVEGPSTCNDFAEFFAGAMSVSNGLKAFGFRGVSLDQRFDPAHDIMTKAGFLLSVAAVLRVKTNGLCWFAPPCGMWVWMSRGASKRKAEDALGGKTNRKVRNRNRLVSRVAHLVCLCHIRRVHVIIE